MKATIATQSTWLLAAKDYMHCICRLHTSAVIQFCLSLLLVPFCSVTSLKPSFPALDGTAPNVCVS